VRDADEAAELMRRLRASPPTQLGEFTSTTTDLSQSTVNQTDALIFTGGDADTWARVVVRPSGTEPKVKFYIEVGCAVAEDLAATRDRATALRDELTAATRAW
jgi:phosphomannomutase